MSTISPNSISSQTPVITSIYLILLHRFLVFTYGLLILLCASQYAWRRLWESIQAWWWRQNTFIFIVWFGDILRSTHHLSRGILIQMSHIYFIYWFMGIPDSCLFGLLFIIVTIVSYMVLSNQVWLTHTHSVVSQIWLAVVAVIFRHGDGYVSLYLTVHLKMSCRFTCDIYHVTNIFVISFATANKNLYWYFFPTLPFTLARPYPKIGFSGSFFSIVQGNRD